MYHGKVTQKKEKAAMIVQKIKWREENKKRVKNEVFG